MGRRGRSPTTHGLVLIDKPAGVTSHDVVDEVRRRFGERQVGHAGTLDPDATGLLVVAVGAPTKLLRFATGLDKDYTADVVLGVETTTLDAAGDVTATHDMTAVTVEDARRVVAEHLLGDIDQIPPMVSALKVQGRRLHELAREGVEVERQPRRVHIERYEVHPTSEVSVLRIEVSCSSGTYVRTLAADLGRHLGGGAHLRRLRRTRIGPFSIEEAAPVDEATLLPPIELLRGIERVTLDADTAARVSNGAVLAAWPGDGPWAVLDELDRLIAVYERHGTDRVKPSVVLAAMAGR
jgi:tRNA pseudouridine55 synthase